MKLYFYILILLFSLKLYSQENKCSEFLNYIELNGELKSRLNNSDLNSSWLFKVSEYKYDNINYVIIETKINRNNISIKKYIYCKIPDNNWNKFKNGENGISDDFGKLFWKYIIKYKCDCK